MNKIPEGWSVKKVSDICEVAYGKDQKQVVCENGKYQIFGTGGVMGKSKEFLYDKPSVLIGRKGTIDKPRFIEKPFWTVDTLFYTKVFESYLPKWFYYFISNTDLTKYNEATGVPSLSRDAIYGIPILLPPLAEQKKIAEILNSVDRSIDATENLITKLENLKKALMQELFTKGIGHTKFKDSLLGRIPEEWEIKILKSIASVKTGPFGAQLHESDYVSKGTPIITVEHLGEQGITCQNLPRVSREDKMRLSQYTLEAGDIVFSRVGSVDRNCLIKESENDWMFSGRLLRIRLNKKLLCPSFISDYFHQELFKQYIRSIAVGGTMASLNTSLLEDVLVPVPKLGEQTEIASILSANDAKIEKAQSRLNKLQDMKKGMMQDLLTGKRRVIQ
jgi:type I restriction enzyme S subunit